MHALLTFILAILFLVVVHELGHLVVGRLLGVRVKEFSVGFGPNLLYYTTKLKMQVSLRLLLLGGYVRFDESSKPGGFKRLPPWKRILVYLAGPMANILLAFLLFSTMWYRQGIPVVPDVGEGIGRIERNSPADRAGIKEGDVVLSVDGHHFTTYAQIAGYLQRLSNPARGVSLEIFRRNKILNVVVHPSFEKKTKRWFLGIFAPPSLKKPVSPVKAVQLGFQSVVGTSSLIFKTLGGLFRGSVPLKELTGPVGIASIGGEAAAAGLWVFIFFLGLLSVNLALINLFPLPILDGGQVVLALFEWITGRPLSSRLLSALSLLSLLFLLALVILVTAFDIGRLAS